MISSISTERLKQIKSTGLATHEEIQLMAQYIMSSQVDRPKFTDLPKASFHD